ncbi:hypothetical protein IFM89_020058 [Coptis chinensis]|uniref:RRM domain-containing protein n=1 Tax=Coptis chinensis TaxID=261450 RepID=A0A835LMU0_9MAGN|nr:hypothetical protein IFM89_020058 [Coptis chinensis]
MALALTLRRILRNGGSASSAAASAVEPKWTRLIPIRLNTTATTTPLTTPKLFISGLARQTTDEKLKEAFSPFGQILEAKVVVDRASGRSKGFAFVSYATIVEAEKAREEMNAKFLDGWVIFVDPAKPREWRSPPKPEPEQSETGFRTNKTIGWCG